jgi:hypothetical protein
VHQYSISELDIGQLTKPSSWIVVVGISASISTTFDMDAGSDSSVGADGAGEDVGATGRVAARAAAMDVADIFGHAV